MRPAPTGHWTTMACATVGGELGLMRLLVLDPGHFHATLLQKDMYAEIEPRVSVYAPLGAEVIEYLRRVSLFNSRAENPTRWELDVHLSDKFVEELLRDRAGDVVVFAGKNRG